MENIISVIVITYNQEKTIARAIESILMQKCHLPIEIEIRDDCSQDATDAICKDFAYKYPNIIRYRQNEQNKGLIDNYFDTLLECRGKYIADCAGDDFWTDPLKLEKEVSILEQNQDVTLVHTAWKNLDEQTGKFQPISQSIHNMPFTDGKSMIEDIVTQTAQPVINLCTALYRKDIFLKEYEKEKYMFRNKFFGCEDMQLCFIMAREGRIGYINEPTLAYSINHKSVSNTEDHEKQFRFVYGTTSLSVYLIHRELLTSDKIDNYLKQRIYAMYMHAFRAHNKKLIGEARYAQKKWLVSNDKKMRMIKGITSCNILWSIMLVLRRLFVILKNYISK